MEKAFLIFVEYLSEIGVYNTAYVLVYASDYDEAKEKVKIKFPSLLDIGNCTIL